MHLQVLPTRIEKPNQFLRLLRIISVTVKFFFKASFFDSNVIPLIILLIMWHKASSHVPDLMLTSHLHLT